MLEDLRRKRVFLLCGHAQSGKTSLSEAILFKCGVTSRLGKVDEGTTISDFEDDEKERKSSINLSVLNAEYKGNSLQFIDTPGYLDFIGDLIASTKAVDFAIIVVDASSGVEVGTEKAWELLRKDRIPCLFFINKLDKENTDYRKTLEEIKNTLSKKAILLSVVENKKIIPVLKNKDKLSQLYNEIIESIAETDDSLLEKYLEKGSLEEGEINQTLKKAVVNCQIYPVIAGIALEEVGVEFLLDTIIEFMPSVEDGLPKKAKDKSNNDTVISPKLDIPFTAQVFKTLFDPYVGQLSIFRIFSGSILSNKEVINATKGNKEKLGQIFILQGKQQIPKETLYTGDIGAVAKLKDTQTQDTLCDPTNIVKFDNFDFPPPAYSASVKPKTRQDEEKISTALSKVANEDPTFSVSRHPQTKELIIHGMGELHLSVIIERMKRKYQADVELGIPKVPYLETIIKSVKVQGKYKKQTGGRGQYGDVWIELEPLERGKDFEFVDAIVGGAIPRNYIPSVEKGIKKAMEQGILAGYPIKDIKVTLYDGSYHPVDSSDIAFQIAASMALKKGMEQAGSVLLEPIVNVEIVIPEEFMGQVTGDINSRRGRVLGMETKGKNQVIKAQVPLAEMFKYASDLRSFTAGRGSYTMSISHYEIVPARIAQTIIEEAQKNKEKEE
ncbi:MAG: elongation factor G [Candidatus Omnitrophica bacterium]|nr:elongation factor G [Candidatus Omnitrophota bacterium]